MTEIYIDSRVCEDLGIKYNLPGSEHKVKVEDFVKSWEKYAKDPYYISERKNDASMRRIKFQDFIKLKEVEVLELKNIRDGHFEI